MGTCPVCQACTFREVEWKSHVGSKWPALECANCGALTLRKHLEPARADHPAVSGVRRLDAQVVVMLKRSG